METPTNLQEAIDFINPRFNGMEKYLDEKSEDSFAAFCHSQISGGIGMKIRNEFEFWRKPGNALYNDLKSNHNCKHPADMSDKIIRGVYQLRKQK